MLCKHCADCYAKFRLFVTTLGVFAFYGGPRRPKPSVIATPPQLVPRKSRSPITLINPSGSSALLNPMLALSSQVHTAALIATQPRLCVSQQRIPLWAVVFAKLAGFRRGGFKGAGTSGDSPVSI